MIGFLTAFTTLAWSDTFTFVTIDDPLADNNRNGTTVTGINNVGQIIGTYFTGMGTLGFLDNGGVFTTISDPNQFLQATLPTGINDSGVIVGNYNAQYDPNNNNGFIYSAGTYTDVGPVYKSYGNGQRYLYQGTSLVGISDAGEIAGVWNPSVNPFTSPPSEAPFGFTDYGGVYTTLPTIGQDVFFPVNINSAGQIFGDYGDYVDDLDQNALYQNGVFTQLNTTFDGFSLWPTAINDAGQMVGNYYQASNNYPNYQEEGFLLSGGVLTTIMYPPALYCGDYYSISCFTAVTGINDEGQIVGYYRNPDGSDHGFVATPTSAPEPSTLTAAFAALAALVGIGGRRYRSHQNDKGDGF